MSWNWSVPPPTSWLVPLSYIKPNQDVDAYLTFQQSTQGVRSGNLSVTHHPQQAPVLWNAYNGTDPLIIYNSSATTEASSPSLLQTSAAPSLIPSDGSDTTSLAQTSTVSLSSQVATALIPTSQIITTFLPQTSATTSLSQTKAGVLFHGGDDTTGGAPASPLSAGAKIGITIACVIGGLSLAAWLWTFIKMRKRNPPKQELDPIPGVVEESRDMVGRPEEEVYEINGREGQVELDSTSRHELEVRQRARELDSRERYELGVLNGALALPPELGCHGRDVGTVGHRGCQRQY